jgi:predicted hydrocarbon binding protein
MIPLAFSLSLTPEPGRKWIRRKVEFPFYYSAKSKSVHIMADLVSTTSAVTGVLMRLKTKVEFVGVSAYSSGEDTITFSAIGTLRSASDTPQSIKALISQLGVVRRCEVAGSKKGLLIDRFHTGFQVGAGEPFLMVPTAVLASTFEAVARAFGTGGETILYNQGKAYSTARWAGISLALGPSSRTRLEEVAAMTAAAGWAIVEIRHMPGTSIVEFVNHDCFECSGIAKGGHGCPFIRGMAVGLIESAFGTKVTSEETRCREDGSDACVFILKTIDGRSLD